MAEPVPDSLQKDDTATTTTTNDGTPETSLPTNAEDRAAAAALSSLNADTSQIENGEGGGAGGAKGAPSAEDREALGKAMNRLEMIAGSGKKKDVNKGKATTTTGAGAEKAAPAPAADDVKKKPAVKVAADDVNLLVEQLDLTKVKATELLKAHEGDRVKAIRAFVTPTSA